MANSRTAVFSALITSELTEMRKIGMRVPDKAFLMAADQNEIAEYENMSVSEAADLLINLADI